MGEGRLAGASNYLRGRDPRAWRTNVPAYARVRYANVVDAEEEDEPEELVGTPLD